MSRLPRPHSRPQSPSLLSAPPRPSRVTYQMRSWSCALCGTGNPLPPAYHGITPQMLPPELTPQFTTLEYIVDAPAAPPPAAPGMPAPPPTPSALPAPRQVFVYVLDTAVIKEELKALTSSVSQSLTLLPPDAYVALVTFGKDVRVHELGCDEAYRNFVFR